MDKRQLVDGCKRGDSASVEALYRSYSGKLMGICRHYVDSQEVAEDLLHDAFIVMLSSIGQLKNPDKLDSWMGVIVKNMAIDYLKESQHFTHPQEDLDMEDVPDEPMYPVPPYEELMDIRRSRMTVERFEKLCRTHGFAVLDRTLWLINPHYKAKFGLHPVKLKLGMDRIPYLRNWFSTSCWYVVTF